MMEPQTSHEKVIGLRLPNGTEVFPPNTWHGHALHGPENRRAIYDAICNSARNLGLDEVELLGRYSWVTRSRVTAIVWLDPDEVVSLADTGYVGDSVQQLAEASVEPMELGTPDE